MKNFQNILITFAFMLLTTAVSAQTLTGLITRWSDDLTEWDILTDDEDLVGELKVRWPGRNDLTQWQFRLNGTSAIIRQSFRGDPSQWTISCEGENITARVVYRGDFSQWRITNNGQQFTLLSKYGNIADEWLVKEEENGIFDIYTTYEGDPRDWMIVDEMDEEVSLAMKMTFVFVSVFNSLPQY